MTVPVARDLDFLAARLHGRRSGLAEGDQLDALCRVRSLHELARALCPGLAVPHAADIQQRLVHDLLDELSDVLAQVPPAPARLIAWLRVRFGIENLKVAARGFATRTPPAVLEQYVLPLPADLAADLEPLATAPDVDAFVEALPEGAFPAEAEPVLEAYRAMPRPFFLEAALDQAYFTELLARTGRLPARERRGVAPIVEQEVDTYHLALASRGRFRYELEPDVLALLHVPGTALDRDIFAAMLAAPDLPAAAARAVGRVVDRLPREPREEEASADAYAEALEGLAWSRYLRAANLVFRRHHMGLAAVVAYTAIRRVEVANLITLSEGIRADLGADAIRARLVPHRDAEAGRV
jgi:vacuolar-type H+-ATPase subunit C/Vma6